MIPSSLHQQRLFIKRNLQVSSPWSQPPAPVHDELEAFAQERRREAWQAHQMVSNQPIITSFGPRENQQSPPFSCVICIRRYKCDFKIQIDILSLPRLLQLLLCHIDYLPYLTDNKKRSLVDMCLATSLCRIKHTQTEAATKPWMSACASKSTLMHVCTVEELTSAQKCPVPSLRK